MRITTGLSWLCGIGAAVFGAQAVDGIETVFNAFPAGEADFAAVGRYQTAVIAVAKVLLPAEILLAACIFFAIWSMFAGFLAKPSHSTSTVYHGPVAGDFAAIAVGEGKVKQRNTVKGSFNAPVSPEQYAAIRAVAKDILIRSPNGEARSRASELLDRADELRDRADTDQGKMRPIVHDLLKIVEKSGPLVGAVAQAVGLLRAGFNL